MEPETRARRQAITVMVIATLCYCLMDYHAPFRSRAWDKMLHLFDISTEHYAILHNHTWDGVLFYLVLPTITILALRQNPLKWGLGIGRWQWTLGWTVAGTIGATLLLLFAVRMPIFQRYYDRLGPQGNLWPWVALFAVDMLVWEFFFRAFMLFGLEPALGELSIYVQMIPFAIAHIGKPEIETLSSILGGVLIGYIVRHCRSFWPAVVLHLVIGLTMYTI